MNSLQLMQPIKFFGKQLAFRLLVGWLTLPIYVIVSPAAA